MAHLLRLDTGRQAPQWPYSLNRDSSQSRGLSSWIPFGPTRGKDLIYPLAYPTSVYGTAVLSSAPNDNAMAHDSAGNSHWSFANTKNHYPVSNKFTLFFRFFPRALNDLQGFCQQQSDTAVSWYLFSYIDKAVATFGVYIATVGYSTSDTAFWEVNKTHDFCGVYDGAALRIYKNGKQTSSAAVSGNVDNPASAYTVFFRQPYYGGHTNGYMYDFRFWNDRALKPAEVLELTDPETRWQMYWQPSTRLWSFPAGGPGTRTLTGASTVANLTSAAVAKAIAQITSSKTIAALANTASLKLLAQIIASSTVSNFLSAGVAGSGANSLTGANTIAALTSAAVMKNLIQITAVQLMAAMSNTAAMKALGQITASQFFAGLSSSAQVRLVQRLTGANQMGNLASIASLINPNAAPQGSMYPYIRRRSRRG